MSKVTSPSDLELDFHSSDAVEYRRMEKWLDEHPDFVHDYFARKASRSMVDGWLISHALSQSTSSPSSGLGMLHTDSGGSSQASSNSKHSSGANTPVRKISAQEFEKGGQILKPMVSTVDGQPTFLGSSSSGSRETTPKNSRKTRSELKALDERELMYELVIDICNDLDVTSLCHKILQNVSILLNADRCSMFLVQGPKDSDSRVLVSTLFDVNIHSSLQDCKDKSEEIRVSWGTGIIGFVAKTGEPVNIPDAYEDPRFNDEIDLKTGYKTRSILCMPITDSGGDVVGVAQAINKVTLKDEPFDEHDEKVFSSYLAFCGIGIRNAQLYERSQLENRRNQLLLDLARVIFEEQSNVAALIHKIMMHTQSLLRCERCQVLLVDDSAKSASSSSSSSVSSSQPSTRAYCLYDNIPPNTMGIFAQVFDLQASDFDNDQSYHREGTHEPRFPINIGITGYVAATGETLNIPEVYEDERFDPAVDEASDFCTHSILCMPIKNALGQVIGVAQLINKMDTTPFNKNDENLFEAFAIFCGMGIHNTQMYEAAVRAMAKQRVALEVLSYHTQAPSTEVQRLKHQTLPTAKQLNLYEYSFNDMLLGDDDTLKACIRMFQELNLLERFRINNDTLCAWLLSVKKNYRNVTYHNWRHAFNVAQTMFCLMTRGVLKDVMGDSERLALLVACLCHDLDHRGTNNQFQIKTMTPLAQLYSTSVMEHHHFDQCIMILNTKGNEILANIPQDQYEVIIKVLEGAILATDLALYFRYRNEFFALLDKGERDWNQEHQRSLLRSMMMTACDVSAITKPWPIQKEVAEVIYDEFFEQGDLEKEKLKTQPIDMMNREKKDELPTMQVNFIDTICLPVYEAFTKITPEYEPLLQGCQANRNNWLSTQAKNRESEQTEGEDKHDKHDDEGDDEETANMSEDNEENSDDKDDDDDHSSVGENESMLKASDQTSTPTTPTSTSTHMRDNNGVERQRGDVQVEVEEDDDSSQCEGQKKKR